MNIAVFWEPSAILTVTGSPLGVALCDGAVGTVDTGGVLLCEEDGGGALPVVGVSVFLLLQAVKPKANAKLSTRQIIFFILFTYSFSAAVPTICSFFSAAS